TWVLYVSSRPSPANVRGPPAPLHDLLAEGMPKSPSDWHKEIIAMRTFVAASAALLLCFHFAHAGDSVAVAEASHMEIIGHSDLNGYGKGGEGLALKQYPGGQRVLYLAHESGPMCM